MQFTPMPDVEAVVALDGSLLLRPISRPALGAGFPGRTSAQRVAPGRNALRTGPPLAGRS